MAADGEGLRQLRTAEAKFRVGSDRDGIGEVVEAAVGLLVAGIDMPNVRILAGEDRADRAELAGALDAALRDLGEAPLDRRSATLLIARDLVRPAIDDAAVAARIAPILWRLFTADVNADWPPAFVRLAGAADGVEDLPWWDGAMPYFMEAARGFRDGED